MAKSLVEPKKPVSRLSQPRRSLSQISFHDGNRKKSVSFSRYEFKQVDTEKLLREGNLCLMLSISWWCWRCFLMILTTTSLT